MPSNKFIFIDDDYNEELTISSNSQMNFLCIPSKSTNINILLNILNSSESNIKLVIVSNECIEVNVESTLLSSNSISNVDVFAIALESSSIKINVNSVIPKDNTNSKVNQRIKGILLSDDSHILGNPNLKIDSHEAIATHALSIGGINKEEEFYLLSKGFSKPESRKLIINSYVNSVLNGLDENEYNKYLEKVSNLLKKG